MYHFFKQHTQPLGAHTRSVVLPHEVFPGSDMVVHLRDRNCNYVAVDVRDLVDINYPDGIQPSKSMGHLGLFKMIPNVSKTLEEFNQVRPFAECVPCIGIRRP